MRYDRKLSFENHIENIKSKVNDRISLLKIFFYDRMLRLNNKLLIRLYKCLVRLVIEYAIMITPNLRRPLMKQLETIQNNCLRIIFKVSRADRLTNESLRKQAKIPKIEDRMKELLERYFERAFVT